MDFTKSRPLFLAPVLLVCAASVASADVITLASQGTAADAGETNTSGGATVVIQRHPSWAPELAGSSWVSYANPNGVVGGQTGDPGGANYVVVPNNTVVTFNQAFTLTGGTAISGSLTVRADDSTSVLLNGNVLASRGGYGRQCIHHLLRLPDRVLDYDATDPQFRGAAALPARGIEHI